MSSKYAPGIYSHEGGDSTTKFPPSYGKAEYSAWTFGDSHVGVPIGPRSGKGAWSIKYSSVPLPRIKPQTPVKSPLDGVKKPNNIILK